MRTANLQTIGLTVKQAAKLMNVSERSVYMARKVRRSGRQDLCDAIERGEMSINKAISILENSPKPTSYDRLIKAWNACNDEQRARFLGELRGGRL